MIITNIIKCKKKISFEEKIIKEIDFDLRRRRAREETVISRQKLILAFAFIRMPGAITVTELQSSRELMVVVVVILQR